METAYYLQQFMAPIASVMDETDVTDIYINGSGGIWLERQSGGIEHIPLPMLDDAALARFARQVAASSSQGISRSSPLLAATLPDGSRIQIVAPPATRAGYAMAIRKQIANDMTLSEWAASGAFEGAEGSDIDTTNDEVSFRSVPKFESAAYLSEAVQMRRNIVIAGGTSTGKTTFLDSLLGEISPQERLVVIEDTHELRLRQPNSVGLIASRSENAEARVNTEDLLIAALRMRPDRILLGELRGSEAFTFLRAINTGHPGSMTTIHADSPRRAIDQLTLLVLQSGARLSWKSVRRYVQASVDVFVQLQRVDGRRLVSHVMARGGP